MKDIKTHLGRLQKRKHELTKGLRERECELSGIITGSPSKNNDEVGKPQAAYYIKFVGSK